MAASRCGALLPAVKWLIASPLLQQAASGSGAVLVQAATSAGSRSVSSRKREEGSKNRTQGERDLTVSAVAAAGRG